MDFKEMAANLGLEEEEFLELFELLMEAGKEDLANLFSAIEEGDATRTAEAAHSLKGAASNLGFMELSEAAKTVEQLAKNDRLDDVSGPARTLMECFESLAPAA